MAVFVLMSLIGVGFMVVEIESRFGVSRWVSIWVIAAALAVLAMLAWLTQRVWDSLQPKIPVVAEENRLMHVEGPPWRRTETEAVDLCEVGWIGWDVDVFDRTETLWLCFYDRDPDLELTFLGFMARNQDAQILGQVPADSLDRSVAARQYLLDYTRHRGIDSTVDLETLEPIPERRPPLAERTTYDGKRLVFRPKQQK